MACQPHPLTDGELVATPDALRPANPVLTPTSYALGQEAEDQHGLYLRVDPANVIGACTRVATACAPRRHVVPRWVWLAASHMACAAATGLAVAYPGAAILVLGWVVVAATALCLVGCIASLSSLGG